MFESFAPYVMNYFISSGDTSSYAGLLIPLLVPIVFIILFLSSMIIFIIYLFPGYFETRKEFIKLWKQRTILGVTIFLFIVMIFCFIMISLNLLKSIDEAKLT